MKPRILPPNTSIPHAQRTSDAKKTSALSGRDGAEMRCLAGGSLIYQQSTNLKNDRHFFCFFFSGGFEKLNITDCLAWHLAVKMQHA